MKIYVHREGQHEAEVVETSADVVVAEALAIDGSEGSVVLVEDTDEVIDLTITLAEAGAEDRVHMFRGRRHRIKAIVNFNGENREREFSASTRVERVFRWAVGKQGFDLSKADAADHTLALPDNSIPPGDVHLGSLDDATPGQMRFNLIPKHRYEG